MRGEMVPPDIFDLAVKERDAFRQSKQRRSPGTQPQVSRLAAASRTRSRARAASDGRRCRCSKSSLRRAFGVGIPGSGPIVQHLVLWVGFLGAAIAARDGKLLALASGTFFPEGRWRRGADIFVGRGGVVHGGAARAAAVSSCS